MHDYNHFQSVLLGDHWEWNVCLNIKRFAKNMVILHPVEVVGRGSETQLQVGEDINQIT